MKNKTSVVSVNPTLQHIFNLELRQLAVSSTAKGVVICMSDHKDAFYGDALYGDALYGDALYGDVLGPRRGGDGDGAGCFVAETNILTPNGEMELGSLKKGDEVLSWNGEECELRARRIQKVLVHKPQSVVDLSYEGNSVPVTVTLNHLLFTQNGWKQVKALSRRDKLIVVQREGVSLAPIRDITKLKGKVPVFNLRTEGEHTFVAGGILAHNFTYLRDVRTKIFQAVESANALIKGGVGQKAQLNLG